MTERDTAGGAKRRLGYRRPARRAAAGVVAAMLAAYAAAVVRPSLETIRELQHELAQLDVRRAAARSAAADERRHQPGGESRPPKRGSLKARELLPEFSLLGRRSGLRIRAIKQSSESAAPGERQIRVLAQGAFPAFVAFLDGIAASLPQGRVQELTLRHLPEAAEIELESVLRVRVEEHDAIGLNRREGGS